MKIRLVPPQELRPSLGRLIADLERRQGAPPFGEVLLSTMAGPDGDGIGVAAEREGRLMAYGFAAPNPDGRVWTLELAAGSPSYEWFLREVLGLLATQGVGEVVLWVHAASVEPPPDVVTPQRRLYRMATALPMAGALPPPDGVIIRGLDPDRDRGPLLELNNLAFAGHPEQGGWTVRDLNRRMAMSWFDPSGVRTAWMGDRMTAFNWTKLHRETEAGGGAVGEIYAIAVNPSYQGLGMGRAIALDGLRYLARCRGATKAILYVDSSNVKAVGMYRSLGFVTEHVDRAYRWVGGR